MPRRPEDRADPVRVLPVRVLPVPVPPDVPVPDVPDAGRDREVRLVWAGGEPHTSQ
jgi:hypothetical protein